MRFDNVKDLRQKGNANENIKWNFRVSPTINTSAVPWNWAVMSFPKNP